MELYKPEIRGDFTSDVLTVLYNDSSLRLHGAFFYGPNAKERAEEYRSFLDSKFQVQLRKHEAGASKDRTRASRD